MAETVQPGPRRDGRGRFQTVVRASGRNGRLRQAKTVRPVTVRKMLARVGMR